MEAFCKDASRTDGLHRFCRPCNSAAQREWRLANPDAERAIGRRYRTRHPQRARELKLARMGLGVDGYEAMLAAQRGRCAICDGGPSGAQRILVVDHDHDTGKVRGLLCDLCNKGLGQFRDRLDLIRSAARYLEDAADVPPPS